MKKIAENAERRFFFADFDPDQYADHDAEDEKNYVKKKPISLIFESGKDILLKEKNFVFQIAFP